MSFNYYTNKGKKTTTTSLNVTKKNYNSDVNQNTVLVPPVLYNTRNIY